MKKEWIYYTFVLAMAILGGIRWYWVIIIAFIALCDLILKYDEVRE